MLKLIKEGKDKKNTELNKGGSSMIIIISCIIAKYISYRFVAIKIAVLVNNLDQLNHLAVELSNSGFKLHRAAQVFMDVIHMMKHSDR